MLLTSLSFIKYIYIYEEGKEGKETVPSWQETIPGQVSSDSARSRSILNYLTSSQRWHSFPAVMRGI